MLTAQIGGSSCDNPDSDALDLFNLGALGLSLFPQDGRARLVSPWRFISGAGYFTT